MIRASLAAAITFWPLAIATGSAQVEPDTVQVFRGYVQEADTGPGWRLVLVYPFTSGSLRVQSLWLPESSGGGRRWTRYRNRLVRATGAVTTVPGPAGPAGLRLDVRRMEAVEVPGTHSRAVRPMISQRAMLTIGVVPNRFAWLETTGDSTGVNPAILFSITNDGEAPLEFEFRSNDVICAAVFQGDDPRPRWRYSWKGDAVTRRLSIGLGTVLRWVVPLPPEAAREPGVYGAEASLCEVQDYRARVEFEVIPRSERLRPR